MTAMLEREARQTTRTAAPPVPRTAGRRRHPTSGASDAVALAVWVSLLVVTALWVSNGGVQAIFTSGQSAIGSIGRLTGLYASDLLLLQVLGMSRIPSVERAVGQDRLAYWHRLSGMTSFYLMLAHIVLIVLAYSSLAQVPFVGELWTMVLTYPGMLLAAAATVLLFGVVGLSIKAARRRVRYESWHLLHLYAYLGAGLALPHQLWTGTDFIASAWARTYWMTMYFGALACVLLFRIGLPFWRTLRHRLRVSAVRQEAPGVTAIHISGRAIDRLRAQPGQFFVWRFKHGDGWTRGHPFSLSAAPTANRLRITVDTTGDDGARISSLPPGTPVLIEGPYGRLTSAVRTRPKLAVFSAGVGLAPVLALLQEDAVWRDGATLVHRMSRENEAIHRGDIQDLVRNADLRWFELVGPRSRSGASWLPAQLAHRRGDLAVRDLIPDIDQHDVYVCGPPAWADSLVESLRAAGVPDSAIHLETFTW
jgi:predicted ferric reductase